MKKYSINYRFKSALEDSSARQHSTSPLTMTAEQSKNPYGLLFIMVTGDEPMFADTTHFIEPFTK